MDPNRAIEAGALERFKSEMGLSAEEMRDFIETFLAESDRLIADIERALGALDAPGLSMAAHTLKSASATFGAMGLSETCKTIEHRARAGEAATLRDEVEQAKARHVATRLALESYLKGLR